MPNILDVLTRAQSLRQENALNSITPDRAGGIMYDTLILINQMQLEGGSLLISKVYSSVAAMEADTTPTSDLTGRALRPGQLVVIVTSDASSSDMGSEYRYNGPGSWTYVGKVGGLPMDTVPTEGSSNGITSGAVYQLQQDVNTDISQLGQEVNTEKLGFPTSVGLRDYSIKTDGTYGTSTGYKHKLFKVNEGEEYYIFGSGSSGARYAFFNSDAEPVSGGTLPLVPGTVVEEIPYGSGKKVTIPTGCVGLAFYVGSSPFTFIPTLFRYIPLNICLTDEVVSSHENSLVRTETGVGSSNNSYKRSEYIGIDGVSKIIVYNACGATGTACVAFYNSEKTFISAIPNPSASNTDNITIDIPENAKYVRVCHHNNVDNTYRVLFVYSSIGDILANILTKNADQEKDISTNTDGVTKMQEEFPLLYKNILLPIIADGASYTYTTRIKLDAGKRYRVIFSNPSFGSYASANYKLGIYAYSTIDGSDRKVVKVWASGVIVPSFFDFTVDADYPYIAFGSRVNVDESLSALILPQEAVGESYGSSILSLNPKEEFIPKFMSAKKRYYTSSINNLPRPIVFMHLSDIHSNWTNVSRFLEFCDEYAEYIDLKLNTGDTVLDKFVDGIEGYDAISGVENIINVIGNHDTRGYIGTQTDWQLYSGTKELYDAFYKNVASWGVVQPSNIGVDDYYPCYCYKDFAEQGLRLVMVDVMSYDVKEDDWLRSVLTDALANSYDVVIAAHMAGFMPNDSDTPLTKVDCNYSSLYATAATAQQTNAYNSYAYHMIDAVDAFISNGGNFVGYICGHAHYDYIGKKGTDNKQWIYTIGATKSGEMRDYNHVVGTRDQDEFQIISIDTYTKTIKLFKVGANVDKYGRHKNSICIDYANHEIKCEAY
ncbi:MAG: hypothetical protein IJK29_05600 [Bacteroidales bacterium]|nr:hypothetical protein [Bacteroidales bacterium]MBR0052318.1 hypothetical protein [Bacteroidales bacterium]